MKKFKRIPCVILARKNSKGLRKKNIAKIGNITLIQHAIYYAKKSRYVTDIIVSTDDPEIAKISKKNKCITIYPRPKKLCRNNSKTEPALLHALNYFKNKKTNIDIYAYLQVTEPFRPKGILDKCIKNLIDNNKIDSSFAAFEMHKNLWTKNKKTKKFFMLTDESERYKPRQKKIPVLREDSGVSLASRYKILDLKNQRIGKKVILVPYDGVCGLIDIHTYDDLYLARKIYNSKIKF